MQENALSPHLFCGRWFAWFSEFSEPLKDVSTSLWGATLFRKPVVRVGPLQAASPCLALNDANISLTLDVGIFHPGQIVNPFFT
jgi:hypothetical protein